MKYNTKPLFKVSNSTNNQKFKRSKTPITNVTKLNTSSYANTSNISTHLKSRERTQMSTIPINNDQDKSHSIRRNNRFMLLTRNRGAKESDLENLISCTMEQRKPIQNKLNRGYSLYEPTRQQNESWIQPKKLINDEDDRAYVGQIFNYMDTSNDPIINKSVTQQCEDSNETNQLTNKKRKKQVIQSDFDCHRIKLANDRELIDKLNDQIQNIKNKFKEEEINYQRQVILETQEQHTEKTIQGAITLNQLQYLYDELSKEDYQRNYIEIDNILVNNKFFQRFAKGVRIGIIEKCGIQICDADYELFKMGRTNNKIYIILKGSCTLEMKLKVNDEINSLTVLSYYEGQHLNQSNLKVKLDDNFEQNKTDLLFNSLTEHEAFQRQYKQFKVCSEIMTSHIRTQEKSYLLYMENEIFQTILIQSIERDIEPKLLTLSKVPFLSQSIPKSLVPFAAALGTQEYYQGDYVIAKGDIIDRVYICANGEFDVVIETVLERDVINPLLMNKLKPFKFKDQIDSQSRKSIPKNNADQSAWLFLNAKGEVPSRKSYHYCKKQRINGDKISYVHQHTTRTLIQGDLICGRTLLHCTQKDSTISQPQFAQLSVVTKSVSGVIYYLDYKSYLSLPEILQQQILGGIKQIKEYDDIDVDKTVTEIKKWEAYKQQLYKSTVLSKIKNTFKLY